MKNEPEPEALFLDDLQQLTVKEPAEITFNGAPYLEEGERDPICPITMDGSRYVLVLESDQAFQFCKQHEGETLFVAAEGKGKNSVLLTAEPGEDQPGVEAGPPPEEEKTAPAPRRSAPAPSKKAPAKPKAVARSRTTQALKQGAARARPQARRVEAPKTATATRGTVPTRDSQSRWEEFWTENVKRARKFTASRLCGLEICMRAVDHHLEKRKRLQPDAPPYSDERVQAMVATLFIAGDKERRNASSGDWIPSVWDGLPYKDLENYL